MNESLQSGIIVELEGNLGKIRMDSSVTKVNNTTVLMTRNRCFINGQRLKFKDFLHARFKLGERLNFDMIEAGKT